MLVVKSLPLMVAGWVDRLGLCLAMSIQIAPKSSHTCQSFFRVPDLVRQCVCRVAVASVPWISCTCDGNAVSFVKHCEITHFDQCATASTAHRTLLSVA
jgi:hypothetical protein